MSITRSAALWEQGKGEEGAIIMADDRMANLVSSGSFSLVSTIGMREFCVLGRYSL